MHLFSNPIPLGLNLSTINGVNLPLGQVPPLHWTWLANHHTHPSLELDVKIHTLSLATNVIQGGVTSTHVPQLYIVKQEGEQTSPFEEYYEPCLDSFVNSHTCPLGGLKVSSMPNHVPVGKHDTNVVIVTRSQCIMGNIGYGGRTHFRLYIKLHVLTLYLLVCFKAIVDLL